MKQVFAHTLSGRPPDEWEPLRNHLTDVANMASQFATKFNATDWGRVAGLWHDVGKYSEAFQAYLYKENGYEILSEHYRGRIDHATAGAQHANGFL